MKIGTKVVVSTNKDRRGVFYGTLESQDGDKVSLSGARQCVYWSRSTKGFFGLAAAGPREGSRISDAAPLCELDGVTCVLEASPEAQAAWESGLWS